VLDELDSVVMRGEEVGGHRNEDELRSQVSYRARFYCTGDSTDRTLDLNGDMEI
jgi:hypothetical protein